jgi:hypothetical protein
MDDPFYVGANGSIHHSTASAFGDVGAGPVQVVLGWEAATKRARELVEEGKARQSRKEGTGKGKARATSDDMLVDV